MDQNNSINIIILAAGIGSRMQSTLPKLMHLLGNSPLVDHLIYKAKKLNAESIITVIGDDMIKVEKYLANKTKIAYQRNRIGSANAVLCAKDMIDTKTGVVLILYVDTPLVSLDIIHEVCRKVESKESDLCIVGFNEEKENSYGKLIIEDKKLVKIIEHKDCNENEKQITLCNSGIMAIRADRIWEILENIDNKNKNQEYYLTDAIELATGMGLRCEYILDRKENVLGANNKKELAQLEKIFQEQQREKFLDAGVQMIDPESVFFSLDSKIGSEVIIYPNVYIGAGVEIHNRVEIKPFCMLEGVKIEDNCTIGPFARIRPNSHLKEGVHIGNFVEIKESVLEKGVKAGHLSYLGNADVGDNTNIGAGTITCNYDGANKHKTKIGKNTFVGSNSAIVAPIEIKDNATVGAGSVVTKIVEENSLAIARAKQINIANWQRPKKK